MSARTFRSCAHHPTGCGDCRRRWAEEAQEAAQAPQPKEFPATRATQDLLKEMLDAANRDLRDQAAVIGRLNTENKQLREKLDELKTKQRKRTKRSKK